MLQPCEGSLGEPRTTIGPQFACGGRLVPELAPFLKAQERCQMQASYQQAIFNNSQTVFHHKEVIILQLLLL